MEDSEQVERSARVPLPVLGALPRPTVPECHGDVCITCSDEAVAVTLYVPAVAYSCEALKLRAPAASGSVEELPSPQTTVTLNVSTVPGSVNVPLTVSVW